MNRIGAFQIVDWRFDYLIEVEDILSYNGKTVHNRQLKIFVNMDGLIAKDVKHHMKYSEEECFLIEAFEDIHQ